MGWFENTKDDFPTFINYFSNHCTKKNLSFLLLSIRMKLPASLVCLKIAAMYRNFWLVHFRWILNRGWSLTICKNSTCLFQFDWVRSIKLGKSYFIMLIISLCLCLRSLILSALILAGVHPPCSFTVLSQIQQSAHFRASWVISQKACCCFFWKFKGYSFH